MLEMLVREDTFSSKASNNVSPCKIPVSKPTSKVHSYYRPSSQVISHNLLYGHNSYFSSGWNVMDGILVLISFVDLGMSLMSTGSPRIFNILRVRGVAELMLGGSLCRTVW